jgi:hypothetical protein
MDLKGFTPPTILMGDNLTISWRRICFRPAMETFQEALKNEELQTTTFTNGYIAFVCRSYHGYRLQQNRNDYRKNHHD